MYNETYQTNETIQQEVKQINRDALGYEDIGFDASKFIIAGVLLYFGHSFMAMFYQMIISAIVKMTNHVPHAANISSLSGLLGGITCVVIFLIFIRKHLKPILKQFIDGKTWMKALSYVGIMLVAIYIYSFILMVLNIESTSANQDSINSMMYLTPIIAGLYVCVSAPIIEECTFRLCLFRGIGYKNEKVGLIVISCIFAGIHLLSSIATGTLLADLSSLPVYLIGGVGLTFAYYKEKNIAVSIVAHFLYNSFSFLMNLITVFCIL